jgi:AICAR transformylase/IMP cyclohydrolase PurH
MVYIDIQSVITMFKSTYRNSYLRGDEIAKIIEMRYGQNDQKSPAYARDSKSNRPLQDGLPED